MMILITIIVNQGRNKNLKEKIIGILVIMLFVGTAIFSGVRGTVVENHVTVHHIYPVNV